MDQPRSLCEFVAMAGEIAVRGIVEQSVIELGATPADIPGLWNAPGYPELTTGQMVHVAIKKWGL